jgi:hypothetical protein
MGTNNFGLNATTYTTGMISISWGELVLEWFLDPPANIESSKQEPQCARNRRRVRAAARQRIARVLVCDALDGLRAFPAMCRNPHAQSDAQAACFGPEDSDCRFLQLAHCASVRT